MSPHPHDAAALPATSPGAPNALAIDGVPDPMAVLRALLADYETADAALVAEHRRADTSGDSTDVAAPSYYQARDDAAVALVQAAHTLLTVLIAVPMCTAQGQPCADMHTEECNGRRGMRGLALTYSGQPLDPWAPWSDLGDEVAQEGVPDGLIDLLCAARLCGADPDQLAHDAIRTLDEEAHERQTSTPLDERTSR